jgi:tetratricopeptide (TPR) repeat protein
MAFFGGALEAAEKIENYRTMGATYSMIGNVYRLLGAYDKALEAIVRAKSNYQLAGLEEGAAWVAYSMGRLYDAIGNIQEAEASYGEALEIYERLADESGVSTGIAICLDQLGLIMISKGTPELAEPLFRQTLDIYTKSNSLYGISNAWKYLGKTQFALGNHEEAIALLQKSLDYKYESNDALGIPGIYQTLGRVLLAEDKWQAGIDTLMIGLEIAKANNQYQILHDIYGDLAVAYEDRGNFQEATRFYKMQYGLQSFIGPNLVRFKFPELRGIYEMEQSHKQIRSLQQSNQIIALELAKQRII